MEFVDYYKTMGLGDNASADEIKRAYRKLARKYHPDVSKDADGEKKFKEVGEAYQVLKDPERRREYDELRQYRSGATGDFRPPPGWQSSSGVGPGDFDGSVPFEFSDFFEQMFVNRAAQGRSSAAGAESMSIPGQDVHAHLSISLSDAFHGSSTMLSLRTPEYGANGRPQMKQKQLQVKIPQGVINGQKIRLRGQGSPGYGDGRPGDLYIEIEVQEHEQFHLDGKDITLNLPVTPWEAALGATVQVETLSGSVNLTIPPNSRAGQKLRLRGKGMPGSPAGDQYVMLTIMVPEVTTDEQKAAYENMRSLWSIDPRQTGSVK